MYSQARGGGRSEICVWFSCIHTCMRVSEHGSSHLHVVFCCATGTKPGSKYVVELWLQSSPPRWRCTCPDAHSKGAAAVAQPASATAVPCKHVVAVVLWAAQQSPTPPLAGHALADGPSGGVRPFVPARATQPSLERMTFKEQLQVEMVRHGPRRPKQGAPHGCARARVARTHASDQEQATSARTRCGCVLTCCALIKVTTNLCAMVCA